ncbi:MAG: iron ABC transporter permease [Spirochaetia bacterium]|nr:iron ABC transporter permease [Spirochaetia bacterium]
MVKRTVVTAASIGVLLIGTIIWALDSGSVNFTASEILAYLGGAREGGYQIITFIRLPRIIFAMLVGGMLGCAGAILQAVFKNPLVDPFITGISSGAAFGAAAAIVAGVSGLIAPAIAGAFATIFIVYRISMTYTGLDVNRLLLAGVMIGSFFSSLIMFINAVFSRDLIKVVFWLMGDLSNINPDYMLYAVLLALASLAAAIYFANDLNIFTTGEEEARTLGVRTEFIKTLYFCLAGVLTAVSVALSGVIGFVGLIVPHIVRRFTGPDLRAVIPVSFLAGALFLLAADTLARTLFLPAELPVGVITGLAGVPFFLALLPRVRRA